MSTISDAYAAHRHTAIIHGTLLESEPHSHEQAGQHNHPLNRIVFADLEAALRVVVAHCLQRDQDEVAPQTKKD